MIPQERTFIPHPSGEPDHLRDRINELADLLALPPACVAAGPAAVFDTLLDLVLASLRAEFIYGFVRREFVGDALETLRCAPGVRGAVHVEQIAQLAQRWLAEHPPLAAYVVPDPTGNGKITIVHCGLGSDPHTGALVAARRAGFPAESDRLLLRVAAGRAMMELQRARALVSQGQRHALGKQKTEVRFRSYLDAGVAGIAFGSPAKRLLAADDICCGILGYTRAELLQKSWAEITHPDDLAQELKLFDRLLAGDSDAYTLEKRVLRKDGRPALVVKAANAVRGPGGHLDYVVCLIVDIGADKRLETQLRRTRADLERNLLQRAGLLAAGHATLIRDVLEHNSDARDPQLALQHLGLLRERLTQERAALGAESGSGDEFGGIVGRSPALRTVMAQIRKVAPTDATVLLEGETGTGKELLADAVQRLSDRRDRAFIKVNCAAIPASLLESELFGHEKGAFTGAHERRIGRFELADGGTLFLDEVGDMPLELQVKLLRVLQERRIERLGSSASVRTDVRLIAATNCNLAEMVAARTFRADLYYRLNVFPIHVPALRERVEDVPLLLRHFIRQYAWSCRKPITGIAPEDEAQLRRYRWPGNIRELQNVVERSVILSIGPLLDVAWPEPAGNAAQASSPALPDAAATTLASVERDYIRSVVAECRWVIAGPQGAAARLGMKRTTLQYKMRKLGIVRPQ